MRMLVLRSTYYVCHFADLIVWIVFFGLVLRFKYVFHNEAHLVGVLLHFLPVDLLPMNVVRNA
jgi:hypothetical protein